MTIFDYLACIYLKATYNTKLISHHSNQIDYFGSIIDTPQLGTEVNIFSPICLSPFQRDSTNSYSILNKLFDFSSPLCNFCRRKTSISVHLALSATINAIDSLTIMQLFIKNRVLWAEKQPWCPPSVRPPHESEFPIVSSWATTTRPLVTGS